MIRCANSGGGASWVDDLLRIRSLPKEGASFRALATLAIVFEDLALRVNVDRRLLRRCKSLESIEQFYGGNRAMLKRRARSEEASLMR